MKSDFLFTLFEVLIGGPLLVIAAGLLSLLFALALLGAVGRELLSGLLPLEKTLKPGEHSAAISSYHH